MTKIGDMPRTGDDGCVSSIAFFKKWGPVLHDAQTSAARAIYRSGGTNGYFANGCFAALSSCIRGYDFIIAYTGDGVDLSVVDLIDQKKSEQRFRDTKLVFNTLTPTARSLRWVDFLLSDNSPWKALHPFLLDKDPAFCNEVGFAFGNAKEKMPVKLAFNFAMATRFPWEMPAAYSLFLALLDEGIEPNQACFIANNFVLREGATGLNGYYEIVYPWSFLESLSFEAAGAFCLSRPLDLASRKKTHPNCDPLWVVQETKDKWFQKSNAMADELLELPRILEVLQEAIEDQRPYLKGE